MPDPNELIIIININLLLSEAASDVSFCADHSISRPYYNWKFILSSDGLSRMREAHSQDMPMKLYSNVLRKFLGRGNYFQLTIYFKLRYVAILSYDEVTFNINNGGRLSYSVLCIPWAHNPLVSNVSSLPH